MGDESSDLQTTLTGGQKFGKIILIAVNTIFLIFACVLIAVGAYALNGNVQQLAGQTLPQGIIVIGCFLLLMSFMGCFSAWKEWRLGLGIYFILLALLSFIIFVIGIVVYVERNKAANYIEKGWMAADRDIISSLQVDFFCCGLNTFNDSGKKDMQVWNYPCDTPANFVGKDQNSCLMVMVKTFQDSFQTAGGVAIAFGVIQLVSLLLVWYLMKGIRDVAVNTAIEKNRLRTEKDKERNRRKGKGLKVPAGIVL